MEVVVVDNGPLRVLGLSIVLKDVNGKAFDLAGRDAISLCRCGLSQNKPFCDGSHARNGFISKIEARALPPPKPKV
jgi:CDGSH-type Zn-finger protein